MLRRIEAEHLAILADVGVEFGPGLNVLSGETGAGKSLLLDALQLALGGRADPALIAPEHRALRAAALFEAPPGSPALVRLAALGIEPDEGGVLLQREVARQGRGACRINGQLVTASGLREVAACLLAVAGQGEQQRLASPAAQADCLDAFAGGRELRRAVAAAFRDHRAAVEARDREADGRERLRRRDMLAYAVAEIQALGLRAGDEERLEARRALLASAQRLEAAAAAGVEGLWEAEDSVRERLGRLGAEIAAAARLDPALDEVAALLQQAGIAVDEAARALRRYREGLSADPAELAGLEERWLRLQELKRKYGASLEDVLAYAAEAEAELRALEAGEERAAALAAEARACAARLGALCAQLHEARVRAAPALAAEIAAQLRELGMPDARLEIDVVARADAASLAAGEAGAGERGWDNVQFRFSANPGQGAQMLSRVASGGELARLHLALYAVRAEGDEVPAVVFDEVDAGVGGRAAAAVAERLQRLAERRQVLCVTHLAVVAAAADRHFLIEKATADGRTETAVRPLEGEARAAEIARMLDGGRGPTSRRHAEEMLRRAARTG